MSWIDLVEGSTPPTPGANRGKIFLQSGSAYLIEDDDSITDLGAAGSGEANTASNVGGESEVFKQKAGVDLEFRTLKAGDGILLTQNTNDVEISFTGTIQHNNLEGLQGGQADEYYHLTSSEHDDLTDGGDCGIHAHDDRYLTGTSVELDDILIGTRERINFHSGTNVYIEVSDDAGSDEVDVTIHASSGGGGEANTASNIGAGGVGVYDQKVGVDLQFRNINAGSSKVTVTDDGANDEIDIDVDESNIKLDDLGTPDDNTDLDATTTEHGLLPKLSNNANEYMDGQGNWSTPSGTGIHEVLEDTTPQLGGDLNMNGNSFILPFEPASNDTCMGFMISGTVDTNAQGFGAPLFLAADGHFDTADADTTGTAPCVALAAESGTGIKRILLLGMARHDDWNWTTGPGILSPVYLSTSLGTLTQTPPTGEDDVIQPVGWALSDDCLWFIPSPIFFTHS